VHGGAGTTEPVRPKIVSLHRLLVHFEKKRDKKAPYYNVMEDPDFQSRPKLRQIRP
jgi:hypothetical protein